MSKCLRVALLTIKVILDVPALFHFSEYLRTSLYLKNGKGLSPSKEKLSIQCHWSEWSPVNSTSKKNVLKKTNREHSPRRLKAGSIPILSLIRKQHVDLTSCRKIIICLILYIAAESNHSHQDTENQTSSTWWIDIKADKNCAWIG
jgi:hypothetical protein